MTLTLLGGTFNPPHKGHLQAAAFARKATGARKVVFLVTPRNPFKKDDMPSIEERALALKRIATKHWMQISTIEKCFKVAESIKTVRLLRKLYPKEKLCFVMGTDNLVHFHKWRGFMEILGSISVVFINRGGISLHRATRQARFPLWKATVIYKKTVAISSTEIRQGRN